MHERLLQVVLVSALCITAPARGSTVQAGLADAPARIVRLERGERLDLHGVAFTAREPSTVYLALSSEYISAAVLAGSLAAKSGRGAGPGHVLVTPIDGSRTERFLFDARQLRRTLGGEVDANVAQSLAAIEQRQSRLRFFGLLEPVGINASAPAPHGMEGLRQAYLNEPEVVRLRRSAAGSRPRLAQLTAERFVAAISAGDAATVSALLDPAPFTEVTVEREVWMEARRAFAWHLVEDAELRASVGGPLQPSGDDALRYETGGDGASARYALRVVLRDRAAFVASLERMP